MAWDLQEKFPLTTKDTSSITISNKEISKETHFIPNIYGEHEIARRSIIPGKKSCDLCLLNLDINQNFH
jgi:hypothetical protein